MSIDFFAPMASKPLDTDTVRSVERCGRISM
ncbi:Uncharacterised protein [Bordetella pertussis]|nr:Uncharacterised protein [Bordetella pertussis]CFU86679.1 Uncharacterised protein [Bordetella pertussis]CPK98847.1 Uncharacterised protein [Bordetella pertussis]CPM38544.1 Uncharacterised protein [Bordetella pertussis]CPN30563.1 Uncharacterised protein [Bordetella pertussis]